MAQQKGQKPTERQRDFNRNLPGAQTNGLRRAAQIVKQRQQTPYTRDEPHCISCLGPRDRRSHPVCPSCTQRREAGLR